MTQTLEKLTDLEKVQFEAMKRAVRLHKGIIKNALNYFNSFSGFRMVTEEEFNRKFRKYDAKERGVRRGRDVRGYYRSL